jgi:hypothetical protein
VRASAASRSSGADFSSTTIGFTAGRIESGVQPRSRHSVITARSGR